MGTREGETITDLREQIKTLESEIRSKDYQMEQLAKRNKELEREKQSLRKDNELLDMMYERERRKRRTKKC